MSWLFSQALEAEYLAAKRLDGGQSAPLSANNTRPKYYCTDKIPESWKPSRYGMTCAPLTADLGAELLTWYRADSLVRTSPVQGMGPEFSESAQDFGVKWRELSERYDLDTHGWKTHRCLFQEDLPWSSVTLPKWGCLVDGVLSERTTPARLTAGTGAGYWLTPRATDTGKGERTETFVARIGDRTENCFQSLAAQACRGIWPTPTLSPDAQNTNSNRKCGPNSLTECARIGSPLWPTCDVRGFTNDGSLMMLKNKCRSREEWSQMGYCAGIGKKEKIWPTASSRDWKDSPGRAKSGNSSDTIKGSLSPDWVEWLMGWPIGWTDLKREHPEYIDWQEDPADAGKVPRVCAGIKHRAARLKAIGNGQCPQAMGLAWGILSEGII